MPSPAAAKKMLLSSDYPLDKVVYLHTDSHDVTSGDYTVAHGLPFTPLIKVVWSTSPTFATTYGVGDGPLSTNPSFPFLPQLVSAYADSSDIGLTFGNPGSVTNVYLRFYGFMPSDVDVDASFTSASGDLFAFNTDYNYTKLYLAGVTASSTVAGSTESVTHDLGYYPQTEVWYTKGGKMYCLAQNTLLDNSPVSESVEITTTSITMKRDVLLSGSETFHYRIYVDELA